MGHSHDEVWGNDKWPPVVYNKRRSRVVPIPKEAVLVDRSTPWGNPFEMLSEKDRDRVCDDFETYARERVKKEPEWLTPLAGKDLVCWCAPKRCHAFILKKLANNG